MDLVFVVDAFEAEVKVETVIVHAVVPFVPD